MSTPRCASIVVVTTVAVLTTIVAACEPAARAPGGDTPAALPHRTSVDSEAPQTSSSGWNDDAGPFLLVATERDSISIVVLPGIQGERAAIDAEFNASTIRGAQVTLFNRGGRTGLARIGGKATPGEDEGCIGWPLVEITPVRGSLPPWTIGLIAPRVASIALDSIEMLSARDSTDLVNEVVRVASTLPVDSNVAQLSGLPFLVDDLRRLRASGKEIIVANVVRRVHQEANPLEERAFLIAEREHLLSETTADGNQPLKLRLVFNVRVAGREELLEGTEVLAAFGTRNSLKLMLVVARESDRGVRYVLLARTLSGDWDTQWSSALVRC